MTFDSRPGTYEHIQHVQARLARAIAGLQQRLLVHDRSKLASPELEAFDVYSPRLAELEYGATLREMKPALAHHYEANDHHPEHYAAGITGMNLLALIEMLCDWSAAGLRHASNAGLARSIEINQQRFGYSDELKSILLNTVVAIEAEEGPTA